MKIRVRRWGNSLAVRIPKTIAVEMGLTDDSAVRLQVRQGKLVLEPDPSGAPTLEALLRGVRKRNLHGEVDTGPARGREVW